MINKSTLLSLFMFLSISVFGQSSEIMVLKTNGKVVIGDTTLITTPGSYNLYVQNGILTERVKVSLKDGADWSDDAFNHTPSLAEVQESIENNQHLIHIPSAEEVVNQGYELQDMDAKLLEQIEWLWQHMIQLDAENKALKAEIDQLKSASN